MGFAFIVNGLARLSIFVELDQVVHLLVVVDLFFFLFTFLLKLVFIPVELQKYILLMLPLYLVLYLHLHFFLHFQLCILMFPSSGSSDSVTPIFQHLMHLSSFSLFLFSSSSEDVGPELCIFGVKHGNSIK